MLFIFSPYLGPLLQSRSQKSSLMAAKDKGGTKRVITRSASTTIIKRFAIVFLSTVLSALMTKVTCTFLVLNTLTAIIVYEM